MLDELGAASDGETNGTEHTSLGLGEHVLALFVPDVDVESLTLEEELQVAIVLQDRMSGGLVEHSLQCSSSRLDKVRIESTDDLLVRWRWHDDTRVVAVQLVVEPEEVTVAAGNGEIGIAVGLGAGSCPDLVDGMGAGEIADFVGVADGDVE